MSHIFITIREIQVLIDKMMSYGQDWYSEQVLAQLDKDDSYKHLIPRRRLYKYFEKFGHEKIEMRNRTYKKEDIESMLEDERINKLLLDQWERKTQYVSKLDQTVPNIVFKHYREHAELYASWYDEEDVITEEAEQLRIHAMLNKKANELTQTEVKELYHITFGNTAKVW